jgi:hypothetical protein
MILGMSISSFTVLHVVLSLVGILAGFVVVAAMFASKAVNGWTAIFLSATVLTSATGFLFPADKVLPSHVVGVVSLAVLAIAIVAFYNNHLARSWRWIYVVAAVISLYLNVFVLVAQGFLKVGFLNALAPTGSEPAFIIAQLIVLVIFVALGIKTVRSFHPEANSMNLRPA